MVKSLKFFFKATMGAFHVQYKLIFVLFGSNRIINLARMFAVHHEKSFVPVFFKVSIDHLLI